jgi:3',5'-cyclic-AMP phosphodiesterase
MVPPRRVAICDHAPDGRRRAMTTMSTTNEPRGGRVRSLRLVQFTDTHLLVDPDAALRGARTLPRLRACLEHARRHYFPVDAVVVTGDVVHDDPAAYGAVDRVFGGLAVPVLLIPGNHDVPDEMRRQLGHPPFQVGGEFRTANGWQVLLLESWFAEAVDGEGRLGASQLAALERALESGVEPHAFVFLHHPPVPMDSPGLDQIGLLDGAALCRSVSRHARVRGVAWGHAHQALDIYARNGVRFMCTPATSMQFRPRSPTFATDDRPPGYRVIDLGADGSIVSEVVWLEDYEEVSSG